jgi:plasmid stabilization system protein ParE
MASEIRFHEEASAELEAAFEWYYLRSEFAAASFAEEIDQAIELIAQRPNRWPISSPGIRKFVLQRFPFAIFYREINSGIQILAVAHGHRKPGYWARRF